VNHSYLEVEIKLAVSGFAEIVPRLPHAGFKLERERTFEANMVFDTAAATLVNQGRLLRLREYGGESWLTFKGRANGEKHKIREEIETGVSDHAAMQAILERLGYRPIFRYEKYRTQYSDGIGHILLDETPIGRFLELEGTAPWIDRTAKALGFEERDYITKSYGRLYVEYCAARGEAPSDMVFTTSEPKHDI
jgi:adenylate cyclase class 2